MELTQENVTKIIEEEINPHLALHGGSCEVVEMDVENKTVSLRALGGCAGCPASQITLFNGIIPILQEHFPDLEVLPSF